MKSNTLWKMSATDIVSSLRKNELHPKDLVLSAIARIETIDDQVNVLPIRCFERALDQANNFKSSSSLNGNWGLGGLPIAVKDYNDVGGVRTTFGSLIFKKNIPTSPTTPKFIFLRSIIFWLRKIP